MAKDHNYIGSYQKKMWCWHVRSSFCSRLLYACISSACYAGNKTLAQINEAWVDQMLDLYENGVQAGCCLYILFYLILFTMRVILL